MKRKTISDIIYKVQNLTNDYAKPNYQFHSGMVYLINAAATNEIKRLINHKINEG